MKRYYFKEKRTCIPSLKDIYATKKATEIMIALAIINANEFPKEYVEYIYYGNYSELLNVLIEDRTKHLCNNKAIAASKLAYQLKLILHIEKMFYTNI